MWHSACILNRVAAVRKVKQESGEQRRHQAVGNGFYLFPFPPLFASDTKEILPKNLRSILFALTVLLLATAAQAQTTKVQASIPFDFVVGDHAYSPGEYTVKSLSQGSAAIRVDSADGSEKGMTLSNACQKGRPATETVLVFQRLGDNYFLYQDLDGRQYPWP